MSFSDFMNLFNAFLVLHNPNALFNGSNLCVDNNWKDYKIIDMANGEKLERWGDIIIIRPDPQIIWKDKLKPELWKKAGNVLIFFLDTD